MKTRLFFMAVTGALLLGACSTVDSRIQQHASQFAGYPPGVQQKIRAGRIDLGFTMEQVVMAMGEADRHATRTSGESGRSVTQEDWGYAARGGHWSFGLGLGTARGATGFGGGVGVDSGFSDDCNDIALRVVFEDGKVVAVERRTN
jgi:hypothetical protein